jgi:hypothetical protein
MVGHKIRVFAHGNVHSRFMQSGRRYSPINEPFVLSYTPPPNEYRFADPWQWEDFLGHHRVPTGISLAEANSAKRASPPVQYLLPGRALFVGELMVSQDQSHFAVLSADCSFGVYQGAVQLLMAYLKRFPGDTVQLTQKTVEASGARSLWQSGALKRAHDECWVELKAIGRLCILEGSHDLYVHGGDASSRRVWCSSAVTVSFSMREGMPFAAVNDAGSLCVYTGEGNYLWCAKQDIPVSKGQKNQRQAAFSPFYARAAALKNAVGNFLKVVSDALAYLQTRFTAFVVR